MDSSTTPIVKHDALKIRNRRYYGPLMKDVLYFSAVLVSLTTIMYFMKLYYIVFPIIIMTGVIVTAAIAIISFFSGENLFRMLWFNVKRRFR